MITYWHIDNFPINAPKLTKTEHVKYLDAYGFILRINNMKEINKSLQLSKYNS